MAFNGDGPHNKRQRMDSDQNSVRGQHNTTVVANYGGPGGNDEPRRKQRQDDSKPNHVLLFTIINPMYPITVEVLHTICQPSGNVLRIVIFKKNGVQAMVEFDCLDAAVRAKETLHGADIYSGCCTLKIDFAKPEKLNVHKNDTESWDYTVSSLAKENNVNGGRPQPLLQEPHYGSRPQPYNAYSHEPQRYDEMCANPTSYGESFGPPPPDNYRKGTSQTVPPDYREQRNAPFQQPGSVLMVYGLDSLRTNADKLFNLMCLYGNVARIKFLKSKEGTAMVQLGDGVAVERCVQNLNNVIVGVTGAAPPSVQKDDDGGGSGAPAAAASGKTVEHKLQLAFSKQQFLSEVTNPYPLPDKSPSYKEYINNKNNRFMNPTMASKNRIQPPSKILHFFNTPPQVTEGELVQVFKEYDVVPPRAVKLFPMKSERSSSGLLEFETTSEAVAAVMACNHAAIDSPGTKFPFIMKLCFSSSRNMSIRNGDAPQALNTSATTANGNDRRSDTSTSEQSGRPTTMSDAY